MYGGCTGGATDFCEGDVQVACLERCMMGVQEELLTAVREVYR